MMGYLKNNYAKLIVIVFILISVFITNKSFYQSDSYSHPSINADSHQYLAISLQIFKYNTITHDDPRNKGTASNYREFLYPYYLSFFYNFLDWNSHTYYDCIYEKKIKHCEDFYFNILISDIVLLLISLFIIAYFAKENFIRFLISSGFLIFFLIDQKMVFGFSPEFLSSILLVLLSILICETIKRDKNFLLVLSIIIFVALIFIKNIFYYFAIFLFCVSLLGLLLNFYKFISYKIFFYNKIFFKLFIISIFTLILILPYQLRNQITFNNTALTKRGSEVLTIRNEFLKLNYSEIIKGFYFYSPNFFGLKNTEKFKKEQSKSFYNTTLEKSYYRSYNRPFGYVISRFNDEKDKSYKNFELWSNDYQNQIMDYNVKIYLSNMLKQSCLSVLMFFKGINYKWQISDNILESTVFNLMYFFLILCLFHQIITSIINKDILKFILFCPTLYFIFMMSTLTFYEPRMNNTLILVIILSYNCINNGKYNFFSSYFKK